MTDTTDPREGGSEHAELLADLEFYTENDYRNPLQTRPATQAVIRNAIDAIRALEAKVREKTDDAESHLRHERMWRTRAQEAFAEIERLQKLIVDEHVADEARVDELTAARDRISANYDVLLTNHVRVMNERNVAWQERDRLAGEVERNSMILEQVIKDQRDRIDRLTSKLASAREALQWIADNTGRDTWLSQFERRFNHGDVNDLMAAIDAARRAGEGEK